MTYLAMEPGVQVALVTTGGTIAVTLLGFAADFLRRHHRVMTEVRDQVANTHSTNLRDDLDAVGFAIDRVIALQELTARDLAGLRDDLTLERRERLAVTERLNEHVASHSA
ncbi:DUF2746 domain-containing protein [Streptomyces sp. NPDC002547]